MRILLGFGRLRGSSGAIKNLPEPCGSGGSLRKPWKLCVYPHDFSPSRLRQLDHELPHHEREQRETLSIDRLAEEVRETNMIVYPVRVQRRGHRAVFGSEIYLMHGSDKRKNEEIENYFLRYVRSG
jgi:hypothetical protein